MGDNMDSPVARHRIEDLEVGDEIVFKASIPAESVDMFSRITGDVSPLHLDPEFAKRRGFPDRVVHGMLVGGLFSTVAGVHLPGENALLHSVNLKFHAPVLPGDNLEVRAEITQVSAGVGVIVIQATITNERTGEKAASAKMQVGVIEDKQDGGE